MMKTAVTPRADTLGLTMVRSSVIVTLTVS